MDFIEQVEYNESHFRPVIEDPVFKFKFNQYVQVRPSAIYGSCGGRALILDRRLDYTKTAEYRVLILGKKPFWVREFYLDSL